MSVPSTKEILRKYSAKLESEISTSEETYSADYEKFKDELTFRPSRYERLAQSLGNIINIKIAKKDSDKIQEDLISAHIQVTPQQAITLSLVSMLSLFLLTLLTAVAIYFINGTIQLLFAFLGLISSMFLFYYTYTMPKRLGNAWKLKASSQMVPAILYVVVYMKHTSNLERAVAFASQHLEGPLALDFKKIFYDVQTSKYSTIKQSLDLYLESWKSYAPEFIESFHLIESSLYEPTEARRVQILEKALQVILDGVYEKMLRYSREIRSPLTNVYMLGIILPTLGLALLPLASTLLGGIIQWHHVFLLFNLIIPFFVFYMVSEILLKRPGGYGESSILELNPEYKTFTSKKPWILASIIAIPLLLIGLSPFILSYFQIDFTILGSAFLDFQTVGGKTLGPFGTGAVLLSLFIPLSIALFYSIAYKAKTKSLIQSREDTKILETEFTNSLFQLGNRLGDGTPAEIAFGKVANSTQGQKTHEFFSLVNQNIQQLGMSLDSAIFDKRRGALTFFPSPLIATSMRILIESVKKGLKVAAMSLMSISEYVKNISKINSRLRDLLAEIVSDMKSNMTFLAPLLAGIVVGLASMITSILNKLQTLQAQAGSDAVSGFGNIASITSIFDITSMIPPYFIQISIGLYIIEIIFILTSALIVVNSGQDPLKEKYELSKNLKRGVFLYIATALVSIISLSLLASIALGGLAG